MAAGDVWGNSWGASWNGYWAIATVAEDATKGGGARSLQEMRRLERQQLLEMLRQDDEMILPILLQLVRRR